jgi:hypothetical protein
MLPADEPCGENYTPQLVKRWCWFLHSCCTTQATLDAEMDGDLGLFGGWREALNEQMSDMAEGREGSITERDRLSSTSPLPPSQPHTKHIHHTLSSQ